VPDWADWCGAVYIRFLTPSISSAIEPGDAPRRSHRGTNRPAVGAAEEGLFGEGLINRRHDHQRFLVDADRRILEGRTAQFQHLAFPNNAEVGVSGGDHCLLRGGAHRLSP